MANIKSSGFKNDPGSEINPLRSIIPVDGKSFIVGKYDEDGRSKAVGKPADVQEISQNKKLMIKSMSTRGGELMPGFIMTADGPVKASQFKPTPKVTIKPAVQPVPEVKGKRGKKKAAVEVPVQSYVEEVEEQITDTLPLPKETAPETFPVTFSIESGTIRSSCIAILEDDLGLILVYNDMDDISYIPKQGGKLSLTLPGQRKMNVMFLGLRLQWFNNNNQLLVFIKIDKE
jgi:hypothetical protein